MFAALLMMLNAAPTQAAATPVFPPDAKLEKLWGEGEFTEGGALAADGKSRWWVVVLRP